MRSKRPAALMLAALIGLPLAAMAAPADIAICDRLAAHPEDQDKPSDIKGSIDIADTDVPLAVKACKAAASASGAPRRLLFELGRAYEFSRQPVEASKAYRRAIDAGSASAMVGLGVMLITGKGVKPDIAEARRLIEKAANAGDVGGMVNMAAIYGGGVGVPADMKIARDWYAKAAAANSSEAMFQLGLIAQDGDVGPKDDAAAKALFEKAASLDHADAIEQLGVYAEAGRAGPKDEKAALAFYKRAASLGNKEAVQALERLRCPFALKDKDRKIAGNICFDGKN